MLIPKLVRTISERSWNDAYFYMIENKHDEVLVKKVDDWEFWLKRINNIVYRFTFRGEKFMGRIIHDTQFFSSS